MQTAGSTRRDLLVPHERVLDAFGIRLSGGGGRRTSSVRIKWAPSRKNEFDTCHEATADEPTEGHTRAWQVRVRFTARSSFLDTITPREPPRMPLKQQQQPPPQVQRLPPIRRLAASKQLLLATNEPCDVEYQLGVTHTKSAAGSAAHARSRASSSRRVSGWSASPRREPTRWVIERWTLRMARTGPLSSRPINPTRSEQPRSRRPTTSALRMNLRRRWSRRKKAASSSTSNASADSAASVAATSYAGLSVSIASLHTESSSCCSIVAGQTGGQWPTRGTGRQGRDEEAHQVSHSHRESVVVPGWWPSAVPTRALARLVSPRGPRAHVLSGGVDAVPAGVGRPPAGSAGEKLVACASPCRPRWSIRVRPTPAIPAAWLEPALTLSRPLTLRPRDPAKASRPARDRTHQWSGTLARLSARPPLDLAPRLLSSPRCAPPLRSHTRNRVQTEKKRRNSNDAVDSHLGRRPNSADGTSVHAWVGMVCVLGRHSAAWRATFRRLWSGACSWWDQRPEPLALTSGPVSCLASAACALSGTCLL